MFFIKKPYVIYMSIKIEFSTFYRIKSILLSIRTLKFVILKLSELYKKLRPFILRYFYHTINYPIIQTYILIHNTKIYK